MNTNIMIFPFEITYKKKLSGALVKFTTLEILDFIKKDFENSGADSVKILNNTVLAENRLFKIRLRPGLNWNRWGGIAYAKLRIIEKENIRNVVYSFNLTRMLVVGGISGIIFGFISQIYWIGLIAFGVLGILNWTFKLLQHSIAFYATFNDMINERKGNINN
jgi:hypothetical protein